jgi:hypothetical protein
VGAAFARDLTAHRAAGTVAIAASPKIPARTAQPARPLTTTVVISRGATIWALASPVANMPWY